jgi:hypothetical protein
LSAGLLPLLAFAEPPLLVQILDRMSDEQREDVLGDDPHLIGGPLWRPILEHGGSPLLRAVERNIGMTRDHLRTLLAVSARLPGPAAADLLLAVYLNVQTSQHMRARILHGPDNPRLRAGLLRLTAYRASSPVLLHQTFGTTPSPRHHRQVDQQALPAYGAQQLLRPALDLPDPELLVHILGELSGKARSTDAARLRGYRTLWAAAGPAAVEQVLGRMFRPRHGLAGHWITQALAERRPRDGLDLLDLALTEIESPHQTLGRMFTAPTRTRAALALALPRDLDFHDPALRPGVLPEHAVPALVEHEHCPPALARRWGRDPNRADKPGPQPYWRLGQAPDPLPRRSAEGLLLELRPAREALEVFQLRGRLVNDPDFPFAHLRPDRKRPGHLGPASLDAGWQLLRRLVGQHLGTDPDAWVVLTRLLPTFPGTLPELCATAEAMTTR